jgi:hypothetical protein
MTRPAVVALLVAVAWARPATVNAQEELELQIREMRGRIEQMRREVDEHRRMAEALARESQELARRVEELAVRRERAGAESEAAVREARQSVNRAIVALRSLGRPDAVEMLERIMAELGGVERERPVGDRPGAERPSREGDRPPPPERRVGDRPPPPERPARDTPPRPDRPAAERDRPRELSPEAAIERAEIMANAARALREANRPDAAGVMERAARSMRARAQAASGREMRQPREEMPPAPQTIELLQLSAGLWREFGQPERAAQTLRLADRMRSELEERRDPPPPATDRPAPRGDRPPPPPATDRPARPADRPPATDRPMPPPPMRPAAAQQELELLVLAQQAVAQTDNFDAVNTLERVILIRRAALEGRDDEGIRRLRENAPPAQMISRILGMAVRVWTGLGEEEKAARVAALADVYAGVRDGLRPAEPADGRTLAEIPERRREVEDYLESLLVAERTLRETGREEQAAQLRGAREIFAATLGLNVAEARALVANGLTEREAIVEALAAAARTLQERGEAESAAAVLQSIERLRRGGN